MDCHRLRLALVSRYQGTGRRVINVIENDGWIRVHLIFKRNTRVKLYSTRCSGSWHHARLQHALSDAPLKQHWRNTTARFLPDSGVQLSQSRHFHEVTTGFCCRCCICICIWIRSTSKAQAFLMSFQHLFSMKQSLYIALSKTGLLLFLFNKK